MISQNLYPYELGYVAVSQDHEGRGIGKALIGQVVALSEGHGLFATTSDSAMRENLLPKAGFILVGASWKNNQNEELQLFTRAASLNA